MTKAELEKRIEVLEEAIANMLVCASNSLCSVCEDIAREAEKKADDA